MSVMLSQSIVFSVCCEVGFCMVSCTHIHKDGIYTYIRTKCKVYYSQSVDWVGVNIFACNVRLSK